MAGKRKDLRKGAAASERLIDDAAAPFVSVKIQEREASLNA